MEETARLIGAEGAATTLSESGLLSPVLVAYLDDIYLLVPRVDTVRSFEIVARTVKEHAGIRTHLGKLQAWSATPQAAPAGAKWVTKSEISIFQWF